MKHKLIELFGIDKLNQTTQQTAMNAFDKLLLERGNPDESPYMREFLGTLGAHNLSEDTQKDIREKTAMVVELARKGGTIPASLFKWDSTAPAAEQINEVKKSDFRWQPNETVRIDVSTEKISKDDYLWGQPESAYGSIQDSSPYTATELHTNWNGANKFIYADQNSKKILHSNMPDFPAGMKITEPVRNAIAQQGFQIAYIDPLEKDWRNQLRR